jgi:hypothetical protein
MKEASLGVTQGEKYNTRRLLCSALIVTHQEQSTWLRGGVLLNVRIMTAEEDTV